MTETKNSKNSKKSKNLKLCVISMSGGLDSTTLATRAISEGYTVLPVNVIYGQKNIIETEVFHNLINNYFNKKYPGQVLEPVTIDLNSIMTTTLNLWEQLRDSNVIKDATDMEFYTPSRNLLFTSLAAMIGEIAAISTGKIELKIGLGVHKHTQYCRDYWDITPEFVSKMDSLFELNDCISVSMFTPYVNETKSKIVQDAIKFNVPYKETWTCYNPVINNGYSPCLKCEACIEREQAGILAGVHDINNYKIGETI